MGYLDRQCRSVHTRLQLCHAMAIAALFLGAMSGDLVQAANEPDGYPALVKLFQQWREFEHPVMENHLPDYSARAMAEKGMYLVANLVAYYAMKERAAQWGMTGESLAKNEIVLQGGLKSLEICKRHGIPVAYGSDLLGELHWDQSKEFTIRQEVVSPIEIIRSATTIGADVLRMPGQVGTLHPGAYSDVIVVDGNPLKDLALLGDQGKHLSLIMKAGILHKNRLN